MWNFETSKIKKTSKIDLEFYIFKSCLPHINGVKCTWCVKKTCNLLYKKTLKCTKIKIGYDLKLLSFLKMKH
jgi:hypothetical protein